MKSLYQFAILFLSLTTAAQAGVLEFFREVQYPVSQVFIPQGFDDNDSAQFVIHGNFPNNCYQMGMVDTEFDKDTNKIFVRLTAYEYLGKCSDFPSPFLQVVHVGLLGRSGSYGIYDKKTGLYLGALNIEKAKHQGSGTDEVPYVPLHDAFINQADGKTELVLRGEFPWSCLEVGKVKVIVQHDVVVVLSEVARTPGVACTVGHMPFEKTIPIAEALPPREFLLHARTNGGQAINKVFHPVH